MGLFSAGVRIAGDVISHPGAVEDAAKVAGKSIGIGEGAAKEGAEVASKSAGRTAAGHAAKAAGHAATGVGKVGGAIGRNPGPTLRWAGGAWFAKEFGPTIMAAGRSVDGVAKAVEGVATKNGHLTGIGNAALGVGALGAGALAIKKITGNDHDHDGPRPNLAQMGAMPEAYVEAAQQQHKKEHDFIPFNE